MDDFEEHRAHFQALINNGMVWKMEGSMGREAMNLIREGACVLGHESFRDYWGNLVGSRYDVVEGTMGSEEYAIERGYSVLS